MRAIGYIRVSTVHQVEDGLSLEVQRERLAAFATAQGDIEIVGIEEDAGVSAATLERPGVTRALARLKAGDAHALLICKLDRLTRSVRDLSNLIEDYFAKRFRLISVAESFDTRSAAGRMFVGLIALFAQWEREVIGERTSEALQHLKRKGVKLGNAPLGFAHSEELDADGRRVIVQLDSELATIERIRELDAGAMSLREIAAALTAEGHTTKRGGKWAAETVRLVLKRIPDLGIAREQAIAERVFAAHAPVST